ncbi:hypothetical protein ACNS7O_08945 [Haloferacaceae archaeon DSL9]
MTVLSLLGLRTADDFADWYRLGAEYTARVATGMSFDGALVDRERGVEAMRAGRADVDPALGRAIAGTLLADAAFSEPFCEWMPLWYELGLYAPIRYADWRLGRVARRYARGLDAVSVPRYSTPDAVLVAGRPATAHVSGFARQFVLADAVLHLEWFVHAARESGVVVPQSLVERTRRESIAYYAGRRSSLSPEVRRFQALLFTDDEWVRAIDRTYGLDSLLFTAWERILRAERERLERSM